MPLFPFYTIAYRVGRFFSVSDCYYKTLSFSFLFFLRCRFRWDQVKLPLPRSFDLSFLSFSPPPSLFAAAYASYVHTQESVQGDKGEGDRWGGERQRGGDDDAEAATEKKKRKGGRKGPFFVRGLFPLPFPTRPTPRLCPPPRGSRPRRQLQTRAPPPPQV